MKRRGRISPEQWTRLTNPPSNPSHTQHRYRHRAVMWLGIAGFAAISMYLVRHWTLLTDLLSELSHLDGPLRALSLAGLAVLLAIQVLIPPLPGAALVAAAAAAFGLWAAWLFASLGIVVGSLLAYLIGRSIGWNIVGRFLTPEQYRTFSGLEQRWGTLVLVAVFLLPYLADDAICYLAGALRFSFRRFAFSVLVGRLPVVLGWAATGTLLPRLPLPVAVGVVALLLGLSFVVGRHLGEPRAS